MAQSEYVPLLLHRANERRLDTETKRMLIGFEIVENDREYYGVEYVAQEFNLDTASATEKVDAFIDDVEDNFDVYKENFEDIDRKYSRDIDQLLSKHDK